MEIPLILKARDGAGKACAPGPQASSLTYAVPLWYRLMASVIAMVLVAANASGMAEPEWRPSVLGIFFVVVALVAAFYEERWAFDAKSRTVQARLGLMFLAKKLRYPFDELAAVRVDIFQKGRMDQSVLPPEDKMPRSALARLVIDLKDGQSLLLDSVPFRARKRLSETADAISALCGVPRK